MKKCLLPIMILSLIFTATAQEQRLKTSDGVDLYVKVKGTGTPCLYLHGGPGSGSYWFEKFAGEVFEQHFQMIYLDQRGVSRSTSPRDKNFSMDRLVKDFEEVREALGIKQWLIAGHSFGGILQMGYALRHPEAVKGLIMMNCGLDMKKSYRTSWCLKACEFLGLADPRPYLDESVPLNDRWDRLIKQLNEKGLMWKMGYAFPENIKKMNATFGDIPNWNSDFESAAMEIDDYQENLAPLTSLVKAPVLFFYGKTDWMIGPLHYQDMRFPTMMLWESEAGHMPFLEDKDGLVKAVEEYRKKFQF